MPFRICKTFEIESGHMLSKHPGKCAFPHGHTRKIEIVLEAGNLDSSEMVCDFSVLKQVIGGLLEQWDHSMCVNSEDRQYPHLQEIYGIRIIPFDGMDPTTEVMAERIYNHFSDGLRIYSGTRPIRQNVKLIRVRVWETSSSWAEYGD